MKYKVIHPDLSECINRYRCVINGNDIVAINDNKKPVVRICERYAKKGYYTELWYTFDSGKSVLCNYWN